MDRNRNVIITDFGFANRFEHRSDDLMQTSCGSPCYAAPELVISEGLYVGSAVDIWSCGVILYAMLAGYLPFDDDPDNPDGDNINLLYKYIISTQLTFPEYISEGAKDLLGLMLVPDPKLRADLRTIMLHPWLEPYRYLFERSVKDLEASAAEQHRQKRMQFQKQMIRHAKDVHGGASEKNMRSQSAAIRTPGGGDGYDESFQIGSSLYDARPSPKDSAPPSASKKGMAVDTSVINDRSVGDDSLLTSPPRAQPAQQLSSSPEQINHGISLDAQSPSRESARSASKRTPSRHDKSATDESGLGSGTDTVRSKKGMRHTIQVEYSSDPVPEMTDLSIVQSQSQPQPQHWTQDNGDPFLSVDTGGSHLGQMIEISESLPSTPMDTVISMEAQQQQPRAREVAPPTPEKDKSPRKPSGGAPTISISPSTPAKSVKTGTVGLGSPLKESIIHANGNASIPAQPPSSSSRSADSSPEQIGRAIPGPDKPSSGEVNGFHPEEPISPTTSAKNSLGSSSSKKGRHIRGLSIDKLPFRRPGSSSGKDSLNVTQPRRQAASESAPPSTYTNSMLSTATPSVHSVTPSDMTISGISGEDEKTTMKAKDARSKRRKTLSIMMEPIKNR